MSSGEGTEAKLGEAHVGGVEPTTEPQAAPVIESVEAREAAPAAGSPTSGSATAASSGPLSIERIRQLRASQESSGGKGRPAAAPRRPQPAAQSRPVSSSAESQSAASGAPAAEATGASSEEGTAAKPPAGDRGRKKPFQKKPNYTVPASEPPMPKLEVPSRRAGLSSDLQDEFDKVIAGTDLDRMLIGDALLQVGRELEEGQRMQGRVLKVHGEHVFVSLGGANEGMISILQFPEPPVAGSQIDVVVRGYLREEGLYDLTIPGGAISVSDWEDLKEGEIVEAKITGSNAGGLECTVGNVRGFIPASQVAEYRIDDFADFVDQKVLCVVTQANPGRGNLVLSRRAVLERERAEKREQRLSQLEVGAMVEGTVRKIMDFGAFVDIGGLDGLLHVSQLSWEKVKHPSEVVQEGQKIQVRVDKFDPQTGKISLSYRSLQDHPWSDIETRFPVGTLVKGAISRIADFGAFVRLATGVEGLIHLSELAHHRVHKVGNVVKEGQEVEVKVLSVEPERQRMSLSLKAAQQPPQVEAAEEPEVEEPPRELALPKHRGPLKGGTGRSGGGEQFGLKW